MNWLKKMCGAPEKKSPQETMEEFNQQMAAVKSAGTVNDGHYTDSVEQIKFLKREGKNIEAIELLLKCVSATEAESKKANSSLKVDEKFSFLNEGRTDTAWGVAPWYYEQLAILYRKEKQYSKEVEILEIYEKQEKAPGVGSQKLAKRLIKARELYDKFKGNSKI